MNFIEDEKTGRLLDWEACINARELGGYPTEDGGSMRWKALVRADNLAQLTPAGKQAVIDYGIRMVIDLRFPQELDSYPNPFAHSSNGQPPLSNSNGQPPLSNSNGQPPLPNSNGQPHFLNLPLDQDIDVAWPNPEGAAKAMSLMYIDLLENNRYFVSRVLTAIAHARPGGVLFHCHAGKDRTGIIAALALGVARVPPPVIVADYAFDTPKLKAWRDLLEPEPMLPPNQPTYMQVLSSSLPMTMQLTLEYLEQSYGGVGGYLRTTPFSLEDQWLLHDRLVEKA